MSDSQLQETMTLVINRLEQSQDTTLQAAYDAINITDQLVRLLDVLRTIMSKDSVEQKMEECPDAAVIRETVEKLLETAFLVNNVAHELEADADFQHETTQTMKSMIDVLLL